MNETIPIIRAEESKKSVLFEPQNLEGSAIVANKGSDQKASTANNKRTNQSRAPNHDNRYSLWCTLLPEG